MQFANVCPFAEAEWLPRLVRRKVAILHIFTIGFEKVLKSCLLLLAALPGLRWLLGLRKLRSSEKVENLQIGLIL